MKTIWFFINGIRNDPSNQEGWTDEFASLVNVATPDSVKVEKFEYYCSALLRRLGQSKRVDELLRKVNLYTVNGYRVVLVGHSNGCDIIARMLNLNVRVDSVHLFAPAAFEQDYDRALSARMVRRVHIYGSPDDRVLKGANRTARLLARLGLGYGSLGLRGAEFAQRWPGIVFDHSIKGYNHSTWFQPGIYLNESVDLLLRHDAADVRALAPAPTTILPVPPA